MLWSFLLQAVFGQVSPAPVFGGQDLVEGDFVNLFFKVLFVMAALLYTVFAFVVTRQIKVMRNTLITSFSPIIRFVGYAHLLAAVLVLIFFVMVL